MEAFKPLKLLKRVFGDKLLFLNLRFTVTSDLLKSKGDIITHTNLWRKWCHQNYFDATGVYQLDYFPLFLYFIASVDLKNLILEEFQIEIFIMG